MQYLLLWSVLCWGRQEMFPKDVRSVVVWNSPRAGPWSHLHLHSTAQSQSMASTEGHGQLGSVPHCSPTTTPKACSRAQVLAGMQTWHCSKSVLGLTTLGLTLECEPSWARAVQGQEWKPTDPSLLGGTLSLLTIGGAALLRASKALLCKDQHFSRKALCKVVLDTLSSVCELSVADRFCSQMLLSLKVLGSVLLKSTSEASVLPIQCTPITCTVIL